MMHFNNVVEGIADGIGITVPILFLVLIVLTTIYFIFKIQRSKLAIQDSVSWIMFNIILSVIAVTMVATHATNNDAWLDNVASDLGFDSFEIAVLLLVAVWMWLRLFKLTSRFSFLKSKISEISQELGKIRYELDNKNKDIFPKKKEEEKDKE